MSRAFVLKSTPAICWYEFSDSILEGIPEFTNKRKLEEYCQVLCLVEPINEI